MTIWPFATSLRLAGLLLGAMLAASEAAAAPASCSLGAPAPGVQRLDWNGLRLSVSIADACVRGGCGVILDLHGATQRGGAHELETRLRALGADAVSRGALTPFIVVQPTAEGSPPMWQPEDAERLYAFATCAAREWRAPPRSLYLSGFSQGARTAAAMLCAHPDAFAAASLAGGGGDILGECVPALAASPPAILYVHGVQDLLLPATEAEDLTSALRRRLGSDLRTERVGDGEERYRGGDFVVDVLLHNGTGAFTGGHCVPGGRGPLGCATTFVFGERTIDFFIARAKRK